MLSADVRPPPKMFSAVFHVSLNGYDGITSAWPNGNKFRSDIIKWNTPFNLANVTPVTILSCSSYFLYAFLLDGSDQFEVHTRCLLVIGNVGYNLTQTEIPIWCSIRDVIAQAKTIAAFYEPTNPRLSLYWNREDERWTMWKWMACFSPTRKQIVISIGDGVHDAQRTTQLLIARGTWRSRIQLCDHRYIWWNCSVDLARPETVWNAGQKKMLTFD